LLRLLLAVCSVSLSLYSIFLIFLPKHKLIRSPAFNCQNRHI